MKRQKKLIIAILLAVLALLLLIIAGSFVTDPDLSQENKDILVLASDKNEQPGGGVDMAYMVHLENGSLDNYTPVYPGGKSHPSVAAPSSVGGNLMLHDSLWFGTDEGMQYAKEIVASTTGMEADAVVVVYDEGLDAVIDSVRPLEVDGEVTNLSAADIVRENDAYNGYPGSDSVSGNMSRADAVMVLVKALSQTAKDPNKKATMVKTALEEFSKGNILMQPAGSFERLLATKGFESLSL